MSVPMPDEAHSTEHTTQLLTRARSGDRQALEVLVARYLPALQRWARGRLPRWARDLADTSDLVQDTLMNTFRRIEHFEPRGEGALYGYLCHALMNRVRDELRKANVRRVEPGLPHDRPDQGPSPLELAVTRQAVERYEAALARLRPSDRDLVVARIDMGCTYAEIATATGRRSPNAVRMAIGRALVRLTEEMARGQGS